MKKIKNYNRPRNVKKGTLNKMDAEFKKGDSRNKDIWNSHKEKYSTKKPNYLLESLLGDKE